MLSFGFYPISPSSSTNNKENSQQPRIIGDDAMCHVLSLPLMTSPGFWPIVLQEGDLYTTKQSLGYLSPYLYNGVNAVTFVWKNRVRVLYISGSLEDIFLLLIAMLLRQLFTKCIECHSQKDQAERGARTSSAQRPHGRWGTRGGVQRKVRCYIDWLKSWGKITVTVGFENINDSPFSLSYHFLTKWKTCTCSISTV